MILTLDLKNQTIEYYNSQSGNLEEETRELVGCGIKAKDLLTLLPKWQIKQNQTQHQEDRISCGVFVSWFMEQRKEHSFEEICDTPKVNIREMREKIRAGVQIPKASSEKNTDVISFSDEELE